MTKHEPIHGIMMLLLTMCVSIHCFAQSFVVSELKYEVNSDGTSVTVKADNPSDIDGDVTIPFKVIYYDKTYNVTAIGKEAFSNCSDLTSIYIPNSVTQIEFAAFYGCSSLTSIVIPDGVTEISESAFNSCSSLSNITIPDGVSIIGANTFKGCSALTSINLPNSVTEIHTSAFYHCI